MNSHILIPRSVFNEFTNSKKYFFKYEVENHRISKGFPATTYTEEDYFSQTIEMGLNKYVETPLKKLLDYVRNLPDDNTFAINEEIFLVAKNYFRSLIARSPRMLKTIVSNSVYLRFMPEQDRHDMVVDRIMASSNWKLIEREYDFTLIINETNIPFVLPTRGLYEFSINENTCVNIPLTPWCAIHLKEKNQINQPNVAVVIPQGMDDVTFCMNSYAFIKQKSDGIGYVVSYDKNLLNLLESGKM